MEISTLASGCGQAESVDRLCITACTKVQLWLNCPGVGQKALRWHVRVQINLRYQLYQNEEVLCGMLTNIKELVIVCQSCGHEMAGILFSRDKDPLCAQTLSPTTVNKIEAKSRRSL